MILGKLKYKNQVTLPSKIVKLLGLKQDDAISFAIRNGQIIIIPVQVEPRYTPQELQAIDKIVSDEKKKAKTFQVGKGFERAIEDL